MAYIIEHAGKKISLPDFSEISTGAIRKARHESDENKVWVILEEVLSPKDLDALDKLPLSEFTTHMSAWTKGVSLGE